MEVLIRIVGGRPEDGSQVLRVGSVPRLSLLVQLINGVPWESTHLVVPGMRTLLQRLRIHLGEVVGPIRDVYWARSSDPAARIDTDLSDPFAHHPAQDRELHLRVLGVQAHRGGGRLVRGSDPPEGPSPPGKTGTQSGRRSLLITPGLKARRQECPRSPACTGRSTLP